MGANSRHQMPRAPTGRCANRGTITTEESAARYGYRAASFGAVS